MAEPEFGEWLANELVSMLEAALAQTELRAFRGKKIIEESPKDDGGWLPVSLHRFGAGRFVA